MEKIFGIDVSYHNGTINWSKAKSEGVKFAILRAGRTSLSSSKTMAKDVKFEEYYKQAKAIGMPIGAYYYSRCDTVAEGKAEGKFIVDLLKGKKFEYPIFLDIEDTEVLKKTSKRQLTDAVKAMAKVVEDAGYYVAIYSGKYILRDHLIESELSKYDKWIAHYAKECGYKEKDLMMWQFGGETNLLRNKKINGVPSASTDQNYCYVDYTSLIKSKGLNGFNKTLTTTVKSDSNVKSLQTVLNKSYGLKLGVDGSFGPKTKEAIKKHYLKSVIKNEHAKWLQQVLKTLKYNITVDGSYGPATATIVKQFQKSLGLKQDGYAGLDTHTKIINSLK